MAKKSEELTSIALGLSALRVRAEILELWDVVDTVQLAYGMAIVYVRLAMEEDLGKVSEESGGDVVEE